VDMIAQLGDSNTCFCSFNKDSLSLVYFCAYSLVVFHQCITDSGSVLQQNMSERILVTY